MKSPEYVRGVTSIWRELLDNARNANGSDMQKLSDLFSRGGFTDSYYKKTVGRGMLGVRSEEDKQASREIEKFNKITRKTPIDMTVELCEGERARLTASKGDISVTLTGDTVQRAINAPLGEESLRKSLSKLGDTPFVLGKLDCKIEGEVMLPISSLNALRRSCADSLVEEIAAPKKAVIGEKAVKVCNLKPKDRRVGRFFSRGQITDSAKEYFDVITLPLGEFALFGNEVNGFIMPAVIMDSERKNAESLLEKAAKFDPEYAIVSNLGHISLLKKYVPDIKMIADFRFNIGNSQAAAIFEEMGFDSYVASAELTIPQLRDLDGAKAAIVYGRIPLMTLEKCVIKELYTNRRACEICKSGKALMKDRRGFVFPIVRESDHRNIILNSLPTSMSDRPDELSRAGISDRHFLFYTESPTEVDGVIKAFKNALPIAEKVRRI